ncbi:hypothetical protein AFLA_010066 [Aspergillus flavus NRRL3357]|nr:hypothetical protein AFLA_010066 [Aspergillus flavus NRRL3357]
MGIFSQDSKRQKKNKRDSNIHETKKEIGSTTGKQFLPETAQAPQIPTAFNTYSPSPQVTLSPAILTKDGPNPAQSTKTNQRSPTHGFILRPRMRILFPLEYETRYLLFLEVGAEYREWRSISAAGKAFGRALTMSVLKQVT